MFYGKGLVSTLEGCIRVNTNINDNGKIKKNITSMLTEIEGVKGVDVWPNLQPTQSFIALLGNLDMTFSCGTGC